MSVARKAERRSGDWVGLMWENPVGIQPVPPPPPQPCLFWKVPLGTSGLEVTSQASFTAGSPGCRLSQSPCSATAGWLSFWGTWLTVPVLSPPAGIPGQRVLPGLQIPLL